MLGNIIRVVKIFASKSGKTILVLGCGISTLGTSVDSYKNTKGLVNGIDQKMQLEIDCFNSSDLAKADAPIAKEHAHKLDVLFKQKLNLEKSFSFKFTIFVDYFIDMFSFGGALSKTTAFFFLVIFIVFLVAFVLRIYGNFRYRAGYKEEQVFAKEFFLAGSASINPHNVVSSFEEVSLLKKEKEVVTNKQKASDSSGISKKA